MAQEVVGAGTGFVLDLICGGGGTALPGKKCDIGVKRIGRGALRPPLPFQNILSFIWSYLFLSFWRALLLL